MHDFPLKLDLLIAVLIEFRAGSAPVQSQQVVTEGADDPHLVDLVPAAHVSSKFVIER